MGATGLKYGIIVDKKSTQKLLKHPALSNFIVKGKGARTAGPLSREAVERIITSLPIGVDTTATTPPSESAQSVVPAASHFSDLDNFRVVYLNDLESPSQLVGADIDSQFDAYLTVVQVEVDESKISFHDALKKLLPPGCIVPSAFETVGHIAHLNLGCEHLEYKYKIGELMIEKFAAIRTVVNKKHNLDSTFRVCPLEVIGGEEIFETIHVEHAMRFYIDYKNVFWNSRLSGERLRLTQVVPRDSDIYDVMGGVGGFGVYLAKLNNCHVITNDLNPIAHACAQKNIEINKVSHLMRSCNLDARDFIKSIISPKYGPSCLQRRLRERFESIAGEGGGDTDLSSSLSQESSQNSRKRRKIQDSQIKSAEAEGRRPKIYFLMNLPAIAMNFTDAFVGVLPKQPLIEPAEVHVLVYFFANPVAIPGAASARLTAVMGEKAFGLCHIESVTLVRNVSPSKNQYCVDLLVPPTCLMFVES